MWPRTQGGAQLSARPFHCDWWRVTDGCSQGFCALDFLRPCPSSPTDARTVLGFPPPMPQLPPFQSWWNKEGRSLPEEGMKRCALLSPPDVCLFSQVMRVLYENPEHTFESLAARSKQVGSLPAAPLPLTSSTCRCTDIRKRPAQALLSGVRAELVRRCCAGGEGGGKGEGEGGGEGGGAGEGKGEGERSMLCGTKSQRARHLISHGTVSAGGHGTVAGGHGTVAGGHGTQGRGPWQRQRSASSSVE